jgi:hypothetical protein
MLTAQLSNSGQAVTNGVTIRYRRSGTDDRASWVNDFPLPDT